MPLAEDVKKLMKHLKEAIQLALMNLNKEPDAKNYQRLAKYILSYLIVFNRKRAGEVSQVKVTEYTRNMDGTKAITEQDTHLTEAESLYNIEHW